MTSQAYPPAAAPKSGGKKWVLFGCGGCLGLIVLGVVGVFAFVFLILGAIKKSDAYTIALNKATSSAAVQAEAGTPLKETFFSPMGSVNTANGSDSADLVITLQGTKGVAVVIAKGAKPAGGEWNFSMLNATIAPTGGGETKTIDLLSENLPAPAPQ